MSLSPERASQLGTIGGLRRAALNDPSELARSGQVGLRARLLREVDPEGQLDKQERERRLQRAHRAWMLQLALRSTKARRQRLIEAARGVAHGARSVASRRAPSTSPAPTASTVTTAHAARRSQT